MGGNIGNIGHTVGNIGWDLRHAVRDMPTLLVAVLYIKLWLVIHVGAPNLLFTQRRTVVPLR